MSTFLRSRHVKLALKISAVAVIGGLLLLFAAVLSLPSLINSAGVQTRIKKSLSASMGRQIAWTSCVLTRSGSLTLSGLILGDLSLIHI